MMVVMHCGIFFLVYVVFLNSIGRRDVEEAFDKISPTYIRDMLILLSICFVGYIGLWNLRRWGVVLLLLMSIPLIAFGIQVKSLGLPNFLPLIAGLTSLPLWPSLKKP